MRALPTTAVLVLTLLAARPAGAQGAPFEATGEVRFRGWGAIGSGAAFDADRVVGPQVNLSRREDGSWAGDLAGQNLDLEVTGSRFTGPNVNVKFGTKDGKTQIEGLFFGQRIRIEMDRKKLRGKIGACSLDLARRNPQYFEGDVGCISAENRGMPQSGKASLQLLGEAASDRPPEPQLALALIAILPG